MRMRAALLTATTAAVVLAGCATPATAPSASPPVAPPSATETASTGAPEATAPSEPAEPAPSTSSSAPANAGAVDQCPDALVDAWLHFGTSGEVSAQDYEPRAADISEQPVGDADVVCSVALAEPEGMFTYALTVLRGATVPESVADAASAQGLQMEESGQTGAVAAYASPDGSISSTLFGPGDAVLGMSGIDGAESAMLLETTFSADH